MVAAISVARTWPRRIASSARSTRPPSIGKAGIMLNTARKRLTSARRSIIDTLGLSMAAKCAVERCVGVTAISTTAIATLTSGPAIATRNSSLGFSGMRSSRATPPIGSSVTSGVATPKARAVKMWPNSCASTQANKSTMKARADHAACGPPENQLAMKIQPRNSRNVTWIRTAVPAILPILIDQDIKKSSLSPLAVNRQPGRSAQVLAGNLGGDRPLSALDPKWRPIMAQSDVDRVWELMGKISICMLTTHDGEQIRSRPMAALVRRDDDAVYFLGDARRHKDEEIRGNPNVGLAFADGHKFVSVTGHAKVSRDKSKIKELWSTAAKAWW